MGTAPNHAVVVLSRAMDQAGDLIAGARREQWPDPTPCHDWDVGTLVNHLVAAPGNFIAMLRGEQPDWTAPAPRVEGDPAAAFRSVADDLIHLWHQAGDDADPSQADWQTAEFAVHGWDLASATAQTRPLDPEVAERGLAFMSANLTPENRGGAFGAPVTVDDDAPPYDRLVAFAGRDPSGR